MLNNQELNLMHNGITNQNRNWTFVMAWEGLLPLCTLMIFCSIDVLFLLSVKNGS
jgi:hypothetical protein